MKSEIGETDDTGISGLEEDELNLEASIIQSENDTVLCSYEKAYLKVIAELSDLTQNKDLITSDKVSKINNQIWSLIDDWRG